LKPLSVAAGAVRISRTAARFTRRVARFREIVAIIGGYGFDDLLTKIRTPRRWLSQFTAPKTEGLNTWQRIRRACEDLGPTFVKFAQLLTARPDVLPPPLIHELKQLRDQVKAVPFERIRPILEKELGRSYAEVFDEFIEEPFAAGSLAQVYRARLRENGRLVAIKIQRPDIRPVVEVDLEFIGWFARALHDSFPPMRPYDLPAVMQETREGLMRELDFSIEASNSIIFNALNPFPERVFAPRVYTPFTTSRLLVTEWVTGWPPEKAPLGPEARRQLAAAGGNSVLHQIVITGFFHADPHGGNILITPDRRICFLDWGLVGQLTRYMRYFLADLLSAIASQDAAKAVWVASRLSRSNRFLDAVEMEKQITVILRKYQQVALTGEAVGNLILEMIYVFATNGINVVKDFTLLARAVVAIESTARVLDPSFSLTATARPFLAQLARERWNPAFFLSEIYRSVFTAVGKLQELPGDVQRLLRRFESQDISMRLALDGLDRLDELLGSAANRLVMGIIIAATIIGSSMLIAFTERITVLGLPLGYVGYFISTLMGLWIIVDILRHGRHK
jgi:ubiquinone biosynthesis protein